MNHSKIQSQSNKIDKQQIFLMNKYDKYIDLNYDMKKKSVHPFLFLFFLTTDNWIGFVGENLFQRFFMHVF